MPLAHTPDAPLPDARPLNWVDRRAPEGLKPWLKLGRFDRPIGIWLLMLPGWQGIALALGQRNPPGDWPRDWSRALVLFALFAVGAALMRAAGCAYNDIVDKDFDARVARTAERPIPSGRISVKQAWAFVVGCSLISLIILLTLGPVAIGLGVGSLVLVGAYPFMKRITWWPQAWLGLTFNWGALMGYAALNGSVSLPAILLYASGVFWTLGYDTIYALQDMEDDALVGVKSTALRLGRHAPLAVGVFYALSALLAVVAAERADVGALFLTPFAAFVWALARQPRRVRLDDPALALRLFKSNREAGLLLFLALLAGAWR
jgi:4-hydroxybenzoate polyprenyltransferase